MQAGVGPMQGRGANQADAVSEGDVTSDAGGGLDLDASRPGLEQAEPLQVLVQIAIAERGRRVDDGECSQVGGADPAPCASGWSGG